MDPSLENSYRPLTGGMQWMLRTASLLVFLIGIPLVLLTTQTERFFAWTIGSDLTAAFLGAAYWASGVMEWVASRERTWAQARIAVPAMLLFTVLTLVVTVLHLGAFHFDASAWYTAGVAWSWLIVYAVVPLIMAWLLLRQRRLAGSDPGRQVRLPTWTRGVLGVQASILLPLGTALLIAPLTFAPIWPWGLTALTGRAIGAWLVSIGVIVAHAIAENDWARLRPLTSSHALLAVMQLLALLRFGGEIDWGTPAGWIYVAFLVSIGVVGVVGLLSKQPSHAAVTEVRRG